MSRKEHRIHLYPASTLKGFMGMVGCKIRDQSQVSINGWRDEALLTFLKLLVTGWLIFVVV